MSAAPHTASAPPVRAPGLALMWKTVSADCNIACDYCYYSTCRGAVSGRRIDDALLENTIREYMEGSDGAAAFAWQGGEPLLAGLAFFERVVALQAKYAPRNTTIANAIQTNGTLLDDAWARFFREYNFLVGVSVDGPEALHDAHRVTATGKGTHALVMRKIDHLRRREVDFNILTVLHEGNVGRARDLMAFYERERFDFVQFIPGMAFPAQSPDAPPRYRISPEQYGAFLCEAFDLWYAGGSPRMSIRLFDDLLSVHAGHEAGSCKHMRGCSRTLILEQNGDAYPCDFYMGETWKLGNVSVDSLTSLVERPAYRQFLAMKQNMAAECRRCDYLRFCHGGCPRDRARTESGMTAGTDYFCAAHRRLFAYAGDRLALLARRIRIRRLVEAVRAGAPWPDRNAPCVCGSGRKFKRCCAPLRDELELPR